MVVLNTIQKQFVQVVKKICIYHQILVLKFLNKIELKIVICILVLINVLDVNLTLF